MAAKARCRQAELQGNDKVHLLAAYVYSLSHQEQTTEQAE